VVIGHSGQGEAVAANKVEGARAALYYGQEEQIVRLSRRHNNANILSLGAGFLDVEGALAAVLEWLGTDFSGHDRHERRNSQVDAYLNDSDIVVSPAILADTQKELEQEFDRVVQHSETFHVDVEDGEFVDGRSLDFDFSLPSHQSHEAHLMLQSPRDWLEENGHLFDRAIVHRESKPDIEALRQVFDGEIGLAFDPGVEAEAQDMSRYDFFQVMTVEPGSYGSEFQPETENKVSKLGTRFPWKQVQVDGHVTPETAEELGGLGAERFVSGSYIQEADDPGAALRRIQRAVGCWPP
jgi:pentose-5-phosphate-3-epimerase